RDVAPRPTSTSRYQSSDDEASDGLGARARGVCQSAGAQGGDVEAAAVGGDRLGVGDIGAEHLARALCAGSQAHHQSLSLAPRPGRELSRISEDAGEMAAGTAQSRGATPAGADAGGTPGTVGDRGLCGVCWGRNPCRTRAERIFGSDLCAATTADEGGSPAEVCSHAAATEETTGSRAAEEGHLAPA